MQIGVICSGSRLFLLVSALCLQSHGWSDRGLTCWVGRRWAGTVGQPAVGAGRAAVTVRCESSGLLRPIVSCEHSPPGLVHPASRTLPGRGQLSLIPHGSPGTSVWARNFLSIVGEKTFLPEDSLLRQKGCRRKERSLCTNKAPYRASATISFLHVPVYLLN